jgi:hypothetical protein
VHLTLGQLEVESLQDLTAIDIDVQILDPKHYDFSLSPGSTGGSSNPYSLQQ